MTDKEQSPTVEKIALGFMVAHHNAVERETVARIATWLRSLKEDENKHVSLCGVEDVAENFAERITEGEWKR